MNKHIAFFPTMPPIIVTWEDETSLPPPQLLQTGDRFLCAQCGNDITHSSLRIAVDGAHRHQMARSFGANQEYGSFSLAPGCAVHGAMKHLAWSQGLTDGTWHMATCAGCGSHMGWYHESPDGQGFFLLILENLRAAKELPDQDASEAP